MSASACILVVDDNAEFRALAAELLERELYQVKTAANPLEATEKLQADFIDVVLLDERLEPYHSGLEYLQELRQMVPGLGVVIISGHADLDMAVRAMRAGAMDLLLKPVQPRDFLECVKHSLASTEAIRKVRKLRRESAVASQMPEILGTSQALREALAMASAAAPTNASVLILGESGTGKELVARAIHARSPRHHHDMICVNTGGIPSTLMEPTLFGSKRGSFTGSVADQQGLFQAAQGSTIFLDEVGDTTTEVQLRLLRVLQERVIQRVGDTKAIPVDVRVIAATNKSLAEEMKAGRFRQDLFYRLAVLTVELPPLRQRPQDIVPLATYFLEKYRRELGRELAGFTDEALASLEGYDWRGNIRELDNVIQRAVILETGPRIAAETLRLNVPGVGIGLPFEEADRRFRTAYFLHLLRESNQNVSRAAQMAGLHRSTIHKHLRDLGLSDRGEGE